MVCRTLLHTLFAGFAAAACTAAAAHTVPGPAGLIDLQVVDRNSGETLPVYRYQGRRYIAGTPGHRYAVFVHNRSSGRVLTVVAVDGVNAVTGETAAWDQNGYVFSPGQRWEIRGWRKSQERIAAFEFTALPDSYAARTGRPQHVGVIGVAVFREAQRQIPVQPPMLPSAPPDTQGLHERSPRDAAEAASTPAPAAPASPAAERNEARRAAAPEREQKLGTGHGRNEYSWVSTTEFERARSAPDEVITLYYDRRENLMAMGVIPSRPTPQPVPRPFPGSQFVPDPPR